MKGLPPGNETAEHHVYIVTKPIPNVKAGLAAEVKGFAAKGGGNQFMFDNEHTIRQLLDDEYLKEFPWKK